MSNKELFEKEIQFVTHRKGFKLVDPHVMSFPEKEMKKEGNIEQPSCPLRFEGKALLGKKITVYVPIRYCPNGTISRESLATEGFYGFAERSRELFECEITFKPNLKDQWCIEVSE
jgi:hypothetical protein